MHAVCTFFFFFNDTATTEIYTLPLHDALPISSGTRGGREPLLDRAAAAHRRLSRRDCLRQIGRAHVELQSQSNLVCRLLLEKKKPDRINQPHYLSDRPSTHLA